MNVTGNSSFGPPTTADILIPPAIIMVLLFTSLAIFSMITQFRWWKSRFLPQNRIKSSPGQTQSNIIISKNNGPEDRVFISAPVRQAIDTTLDTQDKDINPLLTYLDSDDLHIMNQFMEFQNNPVSLFKVTLPLIISLMFSPVPLLLHAPMVEFFWPKDIVPVPPKINDVIAAFLMPAGLVYAVSFGFAFQDVLGNKDSIDARLQEQKTLVRQCWELVKCCDSLLLKEKIAMGRYIKDALVTWMANLVESKHRKRSDTLWLCIQTTQAAKKRVHLQKCYDGALLDILSKQLLKLESVLSDESLKDKRSIYFLQWLFLEMVGFISFFGILLIRGDSYRLELIMCMLTVFSISSFSYILADLDSPYHGVFRVNLHFAIESVYKLRRDSGEMYENIEHKSP